MKLNSAGVIHVDKVFYKLHVDHAFKQVLAVTDGDHFTVTDFGGEILAEPTRAAPGVTYAGNGRPRGPRPRTSVRPEVLRYQHHMVCSCA
ncbi:hypothetical protein [Nocardioides pantholopis]|uniref:hypothetical protein n=1 Tax=Nocardioides pantholopis TaxID=2483798 RepID=UPI000F07AF8D|nr:hypothetical protein [Nocardioides pantholopis]